MKIKMFCLVTILLAVTMTAGAETTTADPVVDGIAQLCIGRTSDSIILAFIKQRPPQAPVSSGQVMTLKGASCKEEVILALLATSPAPMPTVKISPVTRDMPAATAITGQPTKPGFYLVQDGKLDQIEATAFGRQKIGIKSAGKMIGTFGALKGREKAEIQGPAARIRTSRQPTLLFIPRDDSSPREYVLLHLERQPDKREVTIGSMGITGQSVGFEKKNLVKFTAKKAGEQYQIIFEEPLKPGEYAFYPAGGVRAVGDMASAGGKLYDFGVD
jgi:hypothetical protein